MCIEVKEGDSVEPGDWVIVPNYREIGMNKDRSWSTMVLLEAVPTKFFGRRMEFDMYNVTFGSREEMTLLAESMGVCPKVVMFEPDYEKLFKTGTVYIFHRGK